MNSNSWTLHALSICCHHRIDMRLNFSSSIYQKPFLIFIHKQKKSINVLFLFYLSHIPCNSNLSPSASEETWQGSRKMNVTVRTKGGWRQISKTSRNFQKDSKQFTRINVDNQPFCIGKTKAFISSRIHKIKIWCDSVSKTYQWIRGQI